MRNWEPAPSVPCLRPTSTHAAYTTTHWRAECVRQHSDSPSNIGVHSGRTALPSEDRLLAHDRRRQDMGGAMRVAAWSNGSPSRSGSGYGVRLSVADRERHFDHTWSE